MGFLRVILAICVIIEHSSTILGYRLIGGPLAVEIFFIISGFYMSLILNEKYVDSKSYSLFITNRLLRIYPIYWAIIILILGISLFQNEIFLRSYFKYSENLEYGPFAFLILSNLAIVGQDICMFLGLDLQSGHLFFAENFRLTSPPIHSFLLLNQAWSISLELYFYFIAPFILRRNISVVICIILLSLAIRIFIHYYLNLKHDPWNYRFFPTEFMFFLIGNLSYRYYKTLRVSNASKYIAIFFAGLLVLIIMKFDFIFVSQITKQTILFFITFMGIPYLFLHTKNFRIDKFIGDLSYPMYLVHIPFLMIFNYYNLIAPQHMGIILVLCSVIAGVLLNFLVSDKIEKIRKQRYIKANSDTYLKPSLN